MPSALLFFQKAESALAQGRFSKALSLLGAAGRGASDPFFRAEVLYRRGEALRGLSRFRDALAAYQSSQHLYARCRVPSERLRSLLGASACLRILGRFAEAQRLWQRVPRPERFRSSDPSPEEIHLEIALVARGAGKLALAENLLRRCIRGLSRRSDLEGLRHAWWALGGTARFRGRYGEALAAYRNAEVLARRRKDFAGVAYALCGQAGCLRILGQGRLSLVKYQTAYEMFKKTEDAFGQAYGLCGMGNAYRVWGDAAKSLPLYFKSARLYQRVGDEGSFAFALWGAAGSHRRLGHLTEAARQVRQALRLFEKVKDRRGEVMACLSLGRTLKDLRWARRAAQIARRERLPYETALSRLELAGLEKTRGYFRGLGIPETAVKNWKDLP